MTDPIPAPTRNVDRVLAYARGEAVIDTNQFHEAVEVVGVISQRPAEFQNPAELRAWQREHGEVLTGSWSPVDRRKWWWPFDSAPRFATMDLPAD